MESTILYEGVTRALENVLDKMPNNAYMSGARLGRKPFLGLVMVGKLAGAAFNLLNAVYLDTWSRWVGLLYTWTPAPVHLHTCTPVHLV